MKITISEKQELHFILDDGAAPGICRIRDKVVKDIRQAAGAVSRTVPAGTKCAQAILISTTGEALADALALRLPELSGLRGRLESYAFYLAEQPLEGVESGLVIVGSDRLGTIYGMFHLSELLGVTAWGFWGDAAPSFHERVVLTDTETPVDDGAYRVLVRNGISREPSVRFRGFFINDEWPCFGTWASEHYGGFNAEMYDRVFEYLLRMKGNYLWPAMWSSNFLLDGPGLASMELATEYGIYIGMSHHEPCMRSGEEFTLMKGEDSPYGNEWSYADNREGLLNFWADGLKRVRGQNIFPTVGMRGERDSKMLGEDSTIEENVRLLKEIITEQRRLIAEHINPKVDEVPQLFAVYKEVEDYYFGDGRMEGIQGFEELDHVTLLFCEDNFGNMRALPQGREREHPGGFGMYYHLDYHGSPISYEWVNSTPLARIWEQMSEAYEYGVRKLWIANVGDVKFQEYPLGYFMELAYDYDTWGAKGCAGTAEYTKKWVEKLFGGCASSAQQEEIAWILEESVRLHGFRRAESLNDGIYHPAHYLEGRAMLERALELERRNEQMYRALAGQPCGDAYFSILYYPAAAIANLLKMNLYAGQNHLSAAQGKAIANRYGEKLQACIARDKELARRMADFCGGKWRGMELAPHIGFVNWNDEDWRYPVQHLVTLPQKPRLVVSRADRTESYTNQYFPVPLIIEDFLYPGAGEVILQIANGGQGELAWEIPGECDALVFSRREGSTALEDEVRISAAPDRLRPGECREYMCRVQAGKEYVPLCIRVKREDLSLIPSDTFLMREGICAFLAARYRENVPGGTAGTTAAFRKLDDYGKYGAGMKVFPATAAFNIGDAAEKTAPHLLYEFWTASGGSCRLMLHTSPANPLIYGGRLTLAVSVNGGPVQSADLTGEHYRGGDGNCRRWADGVLNQEHIAVLPIEMKAGKNQILVFAQEAGIVLERLVLCAENGEIRPSYFGPPESYKIL